MPDSSAEREPREVVRWFAELMEQQLRANCRANDHKPGWEDEPVEWLLTRMLQETGEALWAHYTDPGPRGPGTTERKLANVANYAMMMADLVNGWRE